MTNGWHLNLKTIIALMVVITGVGIWVGSQDLRVSALETKVETVAITQEKIVKLEIHLSYVRRDVKEIKKILETITNKLDK